MATPDDRRHDSKQQQQKEEKGVFRKRNITDLCDNGDHEDDPKSKRYIIDVSSDEDEKEHLTGLLRQTDTLHNGPKARAALLDAARPAYSMSSSPRESPTQHRLSSPPVLFSRLLQNEQPGQVRRSTSELASEMISAKPVTTRLSHEDYTVGWICALPIEMMAAKAMLDEFHIPLPNAAGDDNAYQLGAIGGHNVVITCIRHGVYGTTSATAAAIAMRSSYPNSIMTPLLVGIAGGVPTPDKHDIRLGDVVISTPSSEHPAVIQYDYGKAVQDGVLDQKGTLNKPSPGLLGALSHFRSQLLSVRHKVSKNISEALKHHSLSERGFARPAHYTDVLLGRDNSSASSASTNQVEQEIQRESRFHMDPEIHYGCIASGNQVIKDASTRDRIALPADILCFEMEAAGVMDYVPCLVIRGICDYCDAHKSKPWQPYAALAAAAVAKEILAVTTMNWDTSSSSKGKTVLEKRQEILDSLKFEDSDTRRATIKRALPSTCQWLLHQRQVMDWTDPMKYHSHHGLLWIKGKPGAGKSTIMKYIVEHTENLYRDKHDVAIVSFFYNARGSELCRSITGMYRSLLWQIFEQIPALQSLIDGKGASRLMMAPMWTVIALEELLRRVIQSLGTTHLLCYIDALDECPEDQIRHMIRFLEDMLELAKDNHLHICFASRHYPHISVRRGCEFILENQAGHTQDIRRYLDKELLLGHNPVAEELKQKMQAKSGSIFLWIVLVVQIINREYDHGGVHRLIVLLNDIPEQVEDLFRDILTRDNSNLPRLLTSIQWVLFAQRPLTIQEFYYAVLFSEGRFDRQPAYLLPVSTLEMQRYVLSCSKGILEETALIGLSSQPQVQFIHETVREFLLQPGVLKGILPGFDGIADGTSHEALKRSCYQCLLQNSSGRDGKKAGKVGDTAGAGDIPFASYAMSHVLEHAEKAQASGISQAEFLNLFLFEFWQDAGKLSSPHPYISGLNASLYLSSNTNGSLGEFVDFGLRLAANGHENLLGCWLNTQGQDIHWTDRLLHRVHDAVAINNWPMFQILLREDQRKNDGHHSRTKIKHIDMAWFLMQQAFRQFQAHSFHHAPLMASLQDILHSFKLSSDTIEQELHASLIKAVQESNLENTEVILRLDPTTVNRLSYHGAAVHYAIMSNSIPVPDFLLRDPSQSLDVLLFEVASDKRLQLVKKLHEHAADLNLKNDKGQTPLHVAALCDAAAVVVFLIKHGVPLDIRDVNGHTPLDIAHRTGHHKIVQLLQHHGAMHLANSGEAEAAVY